MDKDAPLDWRVPDEEIAQARFYADAMRNDLAITAVRAWSNDIRSWGDWRSKGGFWERNSHAVLQRQFVLVAACIKRYHGEALFYPLIEWLVRNIPKNELAAAFLVTAADYLAVSGGEVASEVYTLLRQREPKHPKLIALRAMLPKADSDASAATDASPLAELDSLNGYEFEGYLTTLLKRSGYLAIATPKSKDYGADVIVEDASGSPIAVIQCKKWRQRVSLSAVQEIVAAKRHYGASTAIVVSISGFQPSCVNLAQSNEVELWGRDEVLQLVRGMMPVTSQLRRDPG